MGKHRGTPAVVPAEDMVDWEFAVKLGSRIAGDGPAVSRDEAAAVVAELRRDAADATGYVRDYTGLQVPENTAPVQVVDRAGWIKANAEAFSTVVAPVVAEMAAKRKQPGTITRSVGAKMTGVEVGGLLGFFAGKVLGQFDPFFEPHGRLLLVAPNVVHVERQLGVDPTDFRLWVCLHEETHRVQFTSTPWLREHLFAQIADLAAAMDISSLVDEGFKQVTEAVRGRGSILDAVTTAEQREILDRVTGMMSLLEGHADVVMDGVGPKVIPTVRKIRRAFDKRRQGSGSLDRFLRRVLGLDAKMAQYRDGAKFVRAVVDKVGMAEFNAVFAAADNLPSKDEIENPDDWVARVL